MAQTFFPVSVVEVTPATASAWTDVDVSAYVPSGATGVLLHLVNTSATAYALGLRKNGSTDERTANAMNQVHCWAAIGVDANRIFEAYAGDITSIDIYLVGYTVAGVTFFTNAYDKSLTALYAWTDINSATEAPSAIGLIWEVQGGSTFYTFGFRKNGSTDDRIHGVINHSTFGVIIGCDASQICEGNIGNTVVDFFLVGYITDGATLNTNATDKSLATIDTWLDLTALPSGAVIGFIEVISTTSYYSYGLRKNGSAEDLYWKAYARAWAFVECDASQLIEGKIQDLAVDFWVVGYATAEAEVVTLGWLAGWAKRVKLTIDNTDIDAALANFPILLYLSISSGRLSDDISFIFDELTSDANRKKIAVTTSDGTTECYVEIEKWDDANEQAWLWVKAPAIASDADTDFYLYYDSTHADNTTYVGDPNSVPAENVWDANFKFVSHMRDDPDTLHIRDSSTNDYDGTKKGAAEPAVTTSGKIDDAQLYDGTNDYISGAITIDLDAQDITLEAWTNFTDFLSGHENPRVIEVRDGDYSVQIIRDSGSTRWVTKHSKWELATAGRQYSIPLVTTWYHVAAVFNVTAQTTTFYVDGSAVEGAANNNIGIGNQLNKYFLGVRGDLVGTSYLKGIEDEVRISTIARPAAWLKATYETGRDDLLDWGSEVVVAKPRSFGYIIG